MPSRARPLALALLVLAAFPPLLPGCGGYGEEDRPVVVSVYPPYDADLPNVVAEFRVVFDQPIHILDRTAVRAYDARGSVPMLVLADPDPRALRIRPDPGVYLIPGSFLLELGAGLEANADGRYRLTSTFVPYTFGQGSNLFVGSEGRAAVVELDPDAFTEVHATPTPDGRPPLGLVGTDVGGHEVVWAQLATGGGDGHAVAFFAPGDGAMAEVSLTTSGGDLSTEHETIFLGRGGRNVYAAFRDQALGQVRLARIDAASGLETGSLVLSPAASSATAPLDVRTSPLGGEVYVTCRTATGDLLVAVDTDRFQELNLGPQPGVDGLPIPNGAGAMTTWGSLVFIANAPQPTGDLTGATLAPPGIYGESGSSVTGGPQDILVTVDGYWLVEALRDYDGVEGLVLRTREVVLDPRPVPVATVPGGGGPAATSVVALAPYRTQVRILSLFDNSTLGTWHWDALGIHQDDLDEVTEGVQPADLSLVAPDPTCATFVAGIVPP